MINNKEQKQVISAKVKPETLKWFRREADKGRTTVSRIVAWYLDRVARKS